MNAPSDSAMFLKIVVVILAMGATGAGLLLARHQRAQAAHELAAARLRILQADARLASLRAQIAASVSPADVADMSQDLGETVPLVNSHQPTPTSDGSTSLALGGEDE